MFECGKTTAGERWSALFKGICIIQLLTFYEVDNKNISENVTEGVSQ